ncbi:competence protein ComEC [Kaistella treverensis]|uniref:Competence protein ComEC n=1 Tax=Kaistella treverensis TaxID=631455 RepID=A0A1I3MUZ1_9FLAO|nr:competence protein ComEC [Kaistella treverensis]
MIFLPEKTLQKQPLLILCLAFILGMALQDYLNFGSKTVIFFLISSSFLLLIFFVKSFFTFKIRAFVLGFLFFSFGIFLHFLHGKKPEFPDFSGKEQVIFKLRKKLNSNEKNRRYEITGWKNNQQFNSVLSVPKAERELDFAHYYRAELFINTLEKPYNDFQFDYGKYLARKNIYFQSYLPGSLEISARNDLSFSEKIRQKRLEILQEIDSAKLSKSTREFTKGIILADRTEMDKTVVQDFSKSGLVHILAISGSHMAIIFWLILAIFKPLFPANFRNFKIVIALLLIWSFAIFIDFGSSVVRSCIMISAYYIFILLQRKPDLLHAMSLAALIILIIDTNQFFDVGFQLSFLAVFGIFWFNQPILKLLPQARNKFQKFFFSIISISFSAQLATLPLMLFYFHQYSFISILANLVIIPFSEVLIIFALLMTFLAAISADFSVLNLVYDFTVTTILKVIHFFADVDFAFFRMIAMTLLKVFLLLIMIYLLRFVIKNFSIKNLARFGYFFLIFISVRMLLNYRAENLNETLEHQFFKEKIWSVKNGPHVTFYAGRNVDEEKIMQYIIEPYLTSRRTKSFQLIIKDENFVYLKSEPPKNISRR